MFMHLAPRYGTHHESCETDGLVGTNGLCHEYVITGIAPIVA
jgi:hypothetical protein